MKRFLVEVKALNQPISIEKDIEVAGPSSNQSGTFKINEGDETNFHMDSDSNTTEKQMYQFSSAEEDGYLTQGEGKKNTQDRKSKIIKKKSTKKFIQDWLKLPEFKTWLLRGNKIDEAICKVCNVTMKAGKSELKKHSLGKNHMKNVDLDTKFNRNQRSIDNFISQNLKVKNADAAICSYIIDQNLPLSSVEPLIELIQSLPERDVTEKICLGKQKATNVIRNGLRPFFNKDLVDKLQNQFFSIYIDETTDVSVKKQLAVMVSFCEHFETKVDIVDIVDCPDGTAVKLYNVLIGTLIENQIPLQNWIGFCADTTNAMMGQYNSVSQLIKKNYPHVFISKCSCHMIHLVASYACTKLSNSLEDLCRNIYNHFSRSPKNTEAFKTFQIFFEVKPHKLLRPCQTRWLSLQECVKRILEQWEPLVHYWIILNSEDPTHSNQHTLQTLQNPLLKCLMYFVSYSLGLFNDFNCFFQMDYPQFPELKDKTEELIKTLALNFMKGSYVRKTLAFKINPLLIEEQVPLNQVYLGVDATDLLFHLPNKEESQVEKLLESVRMFYIEAIEQIKKRFTFQDIHEDSAFLNPKNASELNPSTVYLIAKKYIPQHTTINFTELDKEWRNQSLVSWENDDIPTNTVVYWKDLFHQKKFGGGSKFVNLPILINYFMSLPYSNAAIERLFSALKNIKTDRRNRLDNETISAILCVKYGLKRTGRTPIQLMKNLFHIPQLKHIQANATATESKTLRLSAGNNL